MVEVPTTRHTETADEPRHSPTTTAAAATAFTAAFKFPALPLMLSNRQGGLKLGATQKRRMTPKDGREKKSDNKKRETQW